ncbi:alpha/beta fold hydrolase [Pseudomonas oryzihabitans]|uniref:alpha/beta fold hydrolase n=1 Tax=Pseudomonas oryzihabitans TaxID=47885 RepID=UPI0011A593C6|nr:alpha/beta hydrolase [Pseudomonas oryzihabitans]
MDANSFFFLNRDQLSLHVLQWGRPEATPVIMLHGLRAYAQTWASLAESLGDAYCVYALDQRGRGLSDWAEPASYCTESYVRDLEDLVAHLGLARFMLVGHSLGGSNALEYARQHPGRLIGLVIEDIGPGSSSLGDGAARIRREMQETPNFFADWTSAEAFWRKSRPGLTEAGLASRLAHSMKATDEGVTWRHDQLGIAEARLSITPTDLWPAVRALDCPTLFIRGSRSDFLPGTMLAAMQATNPQVRTLEIADASHYVHDDQGPVFNAAVAGFLHALRPAIQGDQSTTAGKPT